MPDAEFIRPCCHGEALIPNRALIGQCDGRAVHDDPGSAIYIHNLVPRPCPTIRLEWPRDPIPEQTLWTRESRDSDAHWHRLSGECGRWTRLVDFSPIHVDNKGL